MIIRDGKFGVERMKNFARRNILEKYARREF